MPLSQRKLDAFAEWLTARGRGPHTVTQYTGQVRLAHATPSLLTRMRGNLSPKSKRAVKAALASWAKYTDNKALKEQLADFKLPPPDRLKTKTILSREEWGAFQTEALSMKDEAAGAVLALLARRGFRRGAVLHFTRKELTEALSIKTLAFWDKGARRVMFPVNRRFRPQLETLVSFTGWKEVHELLSPATYHAAEQRVYRLVQRAGEAVGFTGAHPHLIRSTYASYYYEACGYNIAKLKEHMQWSQIETAAQYIVQHNREELDEIAEGMFDDG